MVASYWLFVNTGNPNSFFERQDLVIQSLQVIKQHLWLGVGLGNFVNFVPTIRQPVHNIYLLLIAELGLPAASVLIIGFLKYLYKIENWKLKIATLSILVTGLVDHYWLTLPQNILLLVVMLAAVKIMDNAVNGKL